VDPAFLRLLLHTPICDVANVSDWCVGANTVANPVTCAPSHLVVPVDWGSRVGSRVERSLLVPEFVNGHNLFPISSLYIGTVANPIWTGHGHCDRESPKGSAFRILSPLNLPASRLFDIRRIRVRGLLANQVNHANTLLEVDAEVVGIPQHI
jgi:hypothetical protein